MQLINTKISLSKLIWRNIQETWTVSKEIDN